MLARAITIIGLSVMAVSPASAMSVADFLAKADGLQTKGVMALFSPDYGLLKADATDGFKAWRAQVAPPGRPANACPPADVPKMSSDEILAMLKVVPPAQRAATSTADAFVTGLNRRFLCHG